MKKYAFLFITNLLILLALSILMFFLGIDGSTWGDFAVICLLFGMGAAFINLYLSIWIAKQWYGVNIIDSESELSEKQKFLYNKCLELCKKAGIDKVQIGIYNSSEINAFATGPSKNNSQNGVRTPPYPCTGVRLVVGKPLAGQRTGWPTGTKALMVCHLATEGRIETVI